MQTLNHEDFWQAALEQIKLQTTKSTYDQWISGCQLLPASNGNFLISVKNEVTKDWLENRLSGIFHRSIAGLLNIDPDSVEIEFIIRPDNGNGRPDSSEQPVTIAEPVATATETSVPFTTGATFAAETDFAKIWYKKGFAQVPHYVSEFWLPYLGPAAFSLWKYLDSLTSTDIKYPENRWTPPEKHSYTQLAKHLGSQNRRIVAGGPVECSRSLNGRLAGLPIQTDCPQCPFLIHLCKPGKDRDNRCQYWKEGALEILYREHLLALDIDDSSPSPKGHKCILQVWRVFPILTPRQAERLPADIHNGHSRWIKDHQNLLNLAYTDWSNLTDETLVTAQAGYAQYRSLFGHHQFNRILAELIEAGNFLVPTGTKNET